MENTKRDSHMWTKKDVKLVAKLWETKTTGEIAKELGVNKTQLSYISQQMRKAGFTLPKKNKHGYIGSLLKECLLEINGEK